MKHILESGKGRDQMVSHNQRGSHGGIRKASENRLEFGGQKDNLRKGSSLG